MMIYIERQAIQNTQERKEIIGTIFFGCLLFNRVFRWILLAGKDREIEKKFRHRNAEIRRQDRSLAAQ